MPHPLAGGALLCSAYFAPIQWWQKVYRHQSVYIEGCDHFVKQTYRNRCLIATANGTLSLSVPVEKPADGRLDKTRMREVRISDHGDWRRIHWSALCAAYGESPFFEYYQDDIRPFYEKKYDFLFDFNMEIMEKMIELLDIRPNVKVTDEYFPKNTQHFDVVDFRDAIRPKKPLPDPDFTPKRYYQVYEQKHGFLPNMSILDLLFNEGNEAIFHL